MIGWINLSSLIHKSMSSGDDVGPFFVCDLCFLVIPQGCTPRSLEGSDGILRDDHKDPHVGFWVFAVVVDGGEVTVTEW